MSEEYDNICECDGDMKCQFDKNLNTWICFPYDYNKNVYYRKYIDPITSKCYVSFIKNNEFIEWNEWNEWIEFKKKE